MSPLLSLFATLRTCPTHVALVSRERFIESWDQLARDDATAYSKPTLPIMAALLVHDPEFGRLLNEAERTRMAALVQLALDRYETQTNPPNQFGKLLAGSIKK